MAMGDSITAAFAASSIGARSSALTAEALLKKHHNLTAGVGEAPFEFRQLSFAGGKGSDDHHTLPYFLSHYNSSLTGFGSSRTLPQLPSTGYKYEDADALNVALSNTHSWQLAQQVEELKKQTGSITDFDSRWKFLTIMVGANDLCDGNAAPGTGFEACDGNAAHATALVDRYEHYLRSALTSIRDSYNRIVIQLVSLFSVASVPQARAKNWWCKLRSATVNECNCIDRTAEGLTWEEQLASFHNTNKLLNERIQKLTLEFNLQRPDFAVINSVALQDQAIPDISFLSKLDCFHPSDHAHGAVATVLWNGLFQKERAPGPLDASTPAFCPTSESVIYVGERSLSDRLVV